MIVPLLVAGFYGDMVVIDLLAYPLLERWQRWLHPRGVGIWYAIGDSGMWIATTAVITFLSPWWIGWGFNASVITPLIGSIVLLL